ncbi:MAG TPA: methylenetetrahydrofolate--tRNA-(uracil(54)-C(5))-methyltransferase (FADH(2)-oxidizing) TrmFO [Desulfomonilia bacterium]
MNSPVIVIGGGLAGCEAAWILAKKRICVELFEMRPKKMTPAHSTGMLAELVCSNSLKGTDPFTAHGLLKAEMEIMDSLVMKAALSARVPAGKALAVDRESFAAFITDAISSNPFITVNRSEIESVPQDTNCIIATGPLTSDALADDISNITGSGRMFFHDAIAPIIDADSIDMKKAFFGSRWSDDEGDYINCPFNEAQYNLFIDELIKADRVSLHTFEDTKYFEGCLPVEVIAERGSQSLRFGPMRPVGIKNPGTGKRPYAVVQLRKETLKGDAFNMVGFQTRLSYPEQDRVFRLIPGLADAVFLRYGSIHRNTFIDSPRMLEKDLSLRSHPNIIIAGQLTGVEGYMESACSGIIAGMSMAAKISGMEFIPPPPQTATGSLINYITDPAVINFQPMNINYGIIPSPDVPKKDKKSTIHEIALNNIFGWVKH